MKGLINFISEILAWGRVMILMIFHKNFYRYMWSLIIETRNMYYRYKV
ncbi:MAG: hypothetical protein MUC95_05515 [Spirochaetes bacterium]|jgi:hypothetical protein|nr:hypothetical protein [Spirochaetota bacterium]